MAEIDLAVSEGKKQDPEDLRCSPVVLCEEGARSLTQVVPRLTQVCTELDDGVVLIKDEDTGEPIGLELLSYRPGDARFDSVNVELGAGTAR